MNEAAVALEVRLLGQTDVRVAGRSVKFAKRSATLGLIAYLALRRGQPVTREFLAYTLFPDQDDEAALADLRRCLYLGNKALPPGDGPWLIADSETVRWNDAGAALVDASAFESLAADAATHAQAVALYRGDLLEDLYDDWIVVERERLRALYLRTLDTLIDRHRGAREYAMALEYAHRLLAADTWREDVARQAMAIRYAWGDTPGALAEYDRFVKRLRDDMNIGPMPETMALRGAILRNEPLVGGAPGAPIEHRTPDARIRVLPFTGRDAERTRLRHHWDRAARGFGNVVLLCGEAGIGKTRLAGELAQIVEREGGRAHCGGTAVPESPPYQCLIEALRSALPVLTAHPMPPLTVGILARFLPELHTEPTALPDIPPLAPEREAARLLDAFARAFFHLAATRPLLVVFEDLHWAAGTTIDAIEMIGRRIAKTRVLIVGTYRDEETPASHPVRRLVKALSAEGRMTQLQLNRFERSDVAYVLTHVEGLSANDAQVVDRFYIFSEGNPLFLSEAVADALEGATTADEVPVGIRSVIATRMDRLHDTARTVAEIAAICGHGCSVETVRDVAGLTLVETLAGFNELLDRRLMREAGARDRFDFVFTHHLIGGSIYESMQPAVRLRRHARAAHVIEQQSPDTGRARELARHYDRGGIPAEAVRWCVQAARDAAAVYATDDTLGFAATALQHEPGCIDALLLHEEASSRLGQRAAQQADLDRLGQLELDAELRLHVFHRRVLLARATAEGEAERAAVAALEAAAHQANSAYWKGVAACANARLFVSIACYDAAKAAAREALGLLATVDAPHDSIDARSVLIEVWAASGDFAEANRLVLEAQAIALRAGDAAAAAETHMQAASMLMPQQRFDEVLLHASEAAQGFRTIGDRVGEARALVTVATSAVRLSRWAEARGANRSAAEIFEAIGDRAGLARVRMNLGMLHGRCGDLSHARALIRAARDLHIALGDERARAASLLNESFLALWQGELQSAKALAGQALALAQAIGHAAYIATALANLGAAERDLGETDAAIAHMDRGLSLQLELGRLPDAVSDLADLALAHADRDDLPAALDIAERVLTIDAAWTDSAIFPPFPPWAVACVFHWARDERAVDMLRTADQVAQTFAAAIDVPELRAHFRRLPFIVEIRAAVERDEWPAQFRRGR